MLSIEEISKKINDKTFDCRFINSIADFIEYSQLNMFDIKTDLNEEEWNKTLIPFTRENVMKQLREDVSFDFYKALNHRSISAWAMYDVVYNWNIILNEGLEDWNYDNYELYGLPLFKATALKYGFENPIGDDEGNEDYYNTED